MLRSYYEYKDLSLCSLYCNVYQPSNYGYWNNSRVLEWAVRSEAKLKKPLLGPAGIIEIIIGTGREVLNAH